MVLKAGLGTAFFPFGTFRSFPFLKKNVFDEREFLTTYETQKNGKESKAHKECNVLLQRTEKNARTFCSFAKERENVLFFYVLFL